MSFVNPITPSSSCDDEQNNCPISPPMSIWSPDRSLRSVTSNSNRDGDESYGVLRRVYSFDDWDEPARQPKMFHFQEWSEGDSDDDDMSESTPMSYDYWLYDNGVDSKRQITEEPKNEELLHNFDPSALALLDTVSSMSGSSCSKMPDCSGILRNGANAGLLPVDTSFDDVSSPSKSVSSVPEFIVVRKEGRWRRQLARSWRRMVRKTNRRCEV